MADLQITQVRSPNGTSPRQKAALKSLGLGRIGKTTSRPDHPTLRGQIDSVRHLVEVRDA